jgi:hypothetical protein
VMKSGCFQKEHSAREILLVLSFSDVVPGLLVSEERMPFHFSVFYSAIVETVHNPHLAHGCCTSLRAES